MLISYLVTVFNKEESISQTLLAILAQNLPNNISLEIVCVDDASTDRSPHIIKEFQTNHPNIKLIINKINSGPSISINTAAREARGHLFFPIDGDDYIPQNHADTLVKISEKYNVDLIFGKSRRSNNPPKNIPEIKENGIDLDDHPLEFCLKHKICHMGFLVSAKIWHEAKGAYEAVFIQDQSLPMRLSHKCKRLAFIRQEIYFLSERSKNNLSRNTNQQHHDRFFSCRDMLSIIDLSSACKFFLKVQVIASVWKCHRDNNFWKALFSLNFLIYLSNKVLKTTYSERRVLVWLEYFNKLDGVRRISE